MIKNEEFQDEIGDNHVSLSAKNPVRADAFDITDDEKIEKIKKDGKKPLIFTVNFHKYLKMMF